MGKAFAIGSVIALLLVLSSNAQPPAAQPPPTKPLQEYASAEFGFKVRMPGKPTTEGPKEKGTQTTLFIVGEKDASFLVAVTKFHNDVPEDKADFVLDASRDGAMTGMNAALTKETKIKLANKYPGRYLEMSTSQPKGIYRAKFYLAKKCLYTVAILGVPDRVHSDDANKFLESFALLQPPAVKPPAAIPAATQPMREFTSVEGGFKVTMPGNPTTKSKTISGKPTTTFLIDENSTAFMLFFSKLPEEVPEDQCEAMLKDCQDAAIRSFDGTLVKGTSIKLAGKYPGRYIEANVPKLKGVYRAKVYVVNKCLYQVTIIGVPARVNSDDANRYLDSFSLTEKK